MFSVIYRFKLKPGKEKNFQESWKKVTEEFRSLHGGLGSCLHVTDDNLYIAYARWPDRLSWKRKKEFEDKTSLGEMNECIEERFRPILMDVVEDMLNIT